MSLSRHDFAFPQGDSLQRRFEFYGPYGTPIDFTDYLVSFQMRLTPQAPGVLAMLDTASNGGLSFLNEDPTTGIVLLDLSPAVSAALPLGTCNWAMKVSQLPSFSWTPLWGYATVNPDTAK
jgi:hypothetical protein